MRYTKRCKHSTDSCFRRLLTVATATLQTKTSTLCCPNLKPTTITSHLPERGKVSVPSASHVTPSLQRDTFVCHASVYPRVQRCSSPSLFCFQKSPQYTAGLQVFLLNGGTEFASRRWSENKTTTKKGLQISPFSTRLQARL